MFVNVILRMSRCITELKEIKVDENCINILLKSKTHGPSKIGYINICINDRKCLKYTIILLIELI